MHFSHKLHKSETEINHENKLLPEHDFNAKNTVTNPNFQTSNNQLKQAILTSQREQNDQKSHYLVSTTATASS